jgi:hypothetical protein
MKDNAKNRVTDVLFVDEFLLALTESGKCLAIDTSMEFAESSLFIILTTHISLTVVTMQPFE